MDVYHRRPEIETFNVMMLHHSDIEGLLNLYTDENYELFESRMALNILCQRFGLPRARNFKEFLRSYESPTGAPL